MRGGSDAGGGAKGGRGDGGAKSKEAAGGARKAAGGGEAEGAATAGESGSAGGPRGARKEKPAARSRREEAAQPQPPSGGVKQGALWVGVEQAIKDTAREAVEQTGARARVIKKTVGVPDAPVRDDDLILNDPGAHEYGSPEHVDSMFS